MTEDANPTPVAAAEEPVVLVETRGRVMIITLNRPRVKNAVNLAVAEGVARAVDELEVRDDLSVAVLTGAGGSFCSGMDLKAFLTGERPSIPGRGFAGITLRPPTKPIIAAVEGFALAGGCEVVLACDLVVAGRSAFFGISEVKRGLMAAGGGLIRLPRRLPLNIANELALTGEPLTAARGAEFGLVNRLVDDGGALAAAIELAEQVAANGPLALARSKQVLTASADHGIDELWELQRPLVDEVFGSEDAKEGPRAFAEKRSPEWSGR